MNCIKKNISTIQYCFTKYFIVSFFACVSTFLNVLWFQVAISGYVRKSEQIGNPNYLRSQLVRIFDILLYMQSHRSNLYMCIGKKVADVKHEGLLDV